MKRIFLMVLALTAVAWGANYYMRADGTAPNKAAAVGPSSDASKCMNYYTADTTSFSAGDTLFISSLGGSYTAAGYAQSSLHYCLFLQLSGSSGHPIVITGRPNDTPLVDMSAHADSAWPFYFYGCNYVIMQNINVKGSGGHPAVSFEGQSGRNTPGGILVQKVNVLSNYGSSDADHDAFYTGQGSIVTFRNCTSRGARANPYTTANPLNSCFSVHDSAIAYVYNTLCDSSEHWCKVIGNGHAYFTTCTFAKAYNYGLYAAADSGCIDVDSSIFTLAGNVVSSTNRGTVLIKNSTIAGKIGSTIINMGNDTFSTGQVILRKDSIAIDSSGLLAAIQSGADPMKLIWVDSSKVVMKAWTGNGQIASGIFRLTNSTVDFQGGANTAYFASTAAAGNGRFDVYGNRFSRSSNAASSGGIGFLIANTGAGDTGTHQFHHNIWLNTGTTGKSFYCLKAVTGFSIPFISKNNVYRNADSVNDSYIYPVGAPRAGKPACSTANDIYFRGAYSGYATSYTTILIPRNNCEYKIATAYKMGGTGSITTNPAFLDTINFKIDTTSPCWGAGVNVGLTADKWVNPIPGYGSKYSIGANEPFYFKGPATVSPASPKVGQRIGIKIATGFTVTADSARIGTGAKFALMYRAADTTDFLPASAATGTLMLYNAYGDSLNAGTITVTAGGGKRRSGVFGWGSFGLGAFK